ncbi:MAG: 5-(carboxyamino)imidazole ribonucleotide synthase [Haloarculaceae archaeon]
MTLSTPGPTLGVVGGGQLGRMLAEAAGPLGVEVVVSDPTPEAPAAPVARDQVVGDFDDPDAVRELAERADYLTFEIELADPDLLESVGEEFGVPVHPDPDTLRTIEDKLVQKRRLQEAGVPVPAFRGVDGVADLHAAGEELGYPLMCKARRGGYDGRGNVPVGSPDEAADALEAVGGDAMVEEFVDYERELAVMGCRGVDGRDTFPVTETVHREEILRETVAPARADEAVRERAREVAADVLDVMDGRGVFGIELFQGPDDEVLLNEIAPRPHNSGHWTIEGCHTSQFEQHVRAVTGRPLGDTGRRAPTVSANVLGDVSERQSATLRGEERVFETPRAHLHWYGKREVYRLRKMGHVTLVGENGSGPDYLLDRVSDLRDGLTFAE